MAGELLDKGSPKELKEILENMGYSKKAVNEILKWYRSPKFMDGRQ